MPAEEKPERSMPAEWVCYTRRETPEHDAMCDAYLGDAHGYALVNGLLYEVTTMAPDGLERTRWTLARVTAAGVG